MTPRIQSALNHSVTNHEQLWKDALNAFPRDRSRCRYTLRAGGYIAGFAACEAVDLPASDLQIATAYCDFLGETCEGVTCSRKVCSARKGEFRPSTDEVTY